MPRVQRGHGGTGGFGRRPRPPVCRRSSAHWLGTPSRGLGRYALAPTSECIYKNTKTDIYIYYVYIKNISVKMKI